jgi:hypothetical protein
MILLIKKKKFIIEIFKDQKKGGHKYVDIFIRAHSSSSIIKNIFVEKWF